MNAIKPPLVPAWLLALLSVAAFAAASQRLGQVGWLLLAAQLWLAYAMCWSALYAIQRWAAPGRWQVWIGLTVALAVFAGVAVVPLASDFIPERMLSWRWTVERALPPILFTLLFLLPGMLNDWRLQQKQQRQLALAEQRRAVAELSKQVTLAELKSLQAQIEPHFLFNTLAGVQYLVRHNAALADAMLGHLITYLRRAVPSMRAHSTTVQAECELVQAYLEVMKLRLGGRLQVQVDCSAEAAPWAMPPMMLATLVENAIKHGIEPLAQGGRIEVRAQVEDGQLCVRVRDTGAGLSHAGVAAQGGGTGLANISDRLRTLYGDAAHLRVEAAAGGGVVASICIALPALQQPMAAEAAA